MKPLPFLYSGLIITVCGLIYGFVTTNEYGSNIVPETIVEAITDLTCIITVLTGNILTTIGMSLNTKG